MFSCLFDKNVKKEFIELEGCFLVVVVNVKLFIAVSFATNKDI